MGSNNKLSKKQIEDLINKFSVSISDILSQFPEYQSIIAGVNSVSFTSISFEMVKTLSYSKIEYEIPILSYRQRFIELYNEILSQIKESDLTVATYEIFRSLSQQFEYWLKGRYTEGNIITQALPGESLHNYSAAIDFVFYKKDKGFSWDDKLPWNIIQSTAQRLRFSTFSWDKPHVELIDLYINNLKKNLTEKIAEIIKDLGLDPLKNKKKIPYYLSKFKNKK